jgi:uncharacterized protein
MRSPTLDQLRRYAVARTLFRPTTLGRAIARLGFVQADPIRAPARAQDLTLRHRVRGYRAGDLERRYPKLDLEEGFFVNYGFMPRAHYVRMHPRAVGSLRVRWDAAARRRADALLAFVRERGVAHPREVEARFGKARTVNYWGGVSSATTRMLEAMHYRGLLRVVRREQGVRIYGVAEAMPVAADAAGELDALIDVIVGKYAPLPARSLVGLVGRLRFGTPQWAAQVRPALARSRERLANARIAGTVWYWPATQRPESARHTLDEQVRLLTPFDPIVWDRLRFELLWSWRYRFEAYTPPARRTLGYYALPLLWRDSVIGWANVSWKEGQLDCELGFPGTRPRDARFERELAAELARLREFLA